MLKVKKVVDSLREIVFGLEDGMVSTLGAITGIGIASDNHYVIILSGLVIISVESVSMAVGAYLANRSVIEVEKKEVRQEKKEVANQPKEERQELEDIYRHQGWPAALAIDMARVASENPKLFLEEMVTHELRLPVRPKDHSILSAFFMFCSYILGGLIPLLPYFFWSNAPARLLSIIVTMLGLFILGSWTTRITGQRWWKVGLRMVLLGGVAIVIGWLVGRLSPLAIG